ncbi:MAG TPA: GNAT family protein [Candidatus Nanopelagicaceae bacterium]|nr:GNAT family protein [Candidatus Nanopelagicaceae bacterium]
MTVLVGKHVRLEPLTLEHTDDLYNNCGNDEEVWQWLAQHNPTTRDAMHQLVTRSLIERDAGDREPFAVVSMTTGEAIGATSFLDQVPEHRRVEIGWTFYGREFWRTPVNTETKLLLMTEAFEVRNYDRVALKTDVKNERSQVAIARLGATREGVLRHLVIRKDGSPRDSVFFSILANEWPGVKSRLESTLR